jgi:hypothetical protein
MHIKKLVVELWSDEQFQFAVIRGRMLVEAIELRGNAGEMVRLHGQTVPWNDDPYTDEVMRPVEELPEAIQALVGRIVADGKHWRL